MTLARYFMHRSAEVKLCGYNAFVDFCDVACCNGSFFSVTLAASSEGRVERDAVHIFDIRRSIDVPVDVRLDFWPGSLVLIHAFADYAASGNVRAYYIDEEIG